VRRCARDTAEVSGGGAIAATLAVGVVGGFRLVAENGTVGATGFQAVIRIRESFKCSVGGVIDFCVRLSGSRRTAMTRGLGADRSVRGFVWLSPLRARRYSGGR
jgi:hypothetical protein